MSISIPHLPAEPDHPDRQKLRRIGDRVRKRLAANPAVQSIPCEKAELWAAGNFFSADECARLIVMIDANARPTRTYAAGATDPEFRTSAATGLDPRDGLVQRLQARLDDLLGFPAAHGEMMQGQRYRPGEQYKPHTDWFPRHSPGWQIERKNGGQRSFTAMVYLNDVTSGGQTDFPRLDIAVAPRRGTLLVWNNADRDGGPNPFTVHGGNRMGEGAKFVVTRWYRCGPTRQIF